MHVSVRSREVETRTLYGPDIGNSIVGCYTVHFDNILFSQDRNNKRPRNCGVNSDKGFSGDVDSCNLSTRTPLNNYYVPVGIFLVFLSADWSNFRVGPKKLFVTVRVNNFGSTMWHFNNIKI